MSRKWAAIGLSVVAGLAGWGLLLAASYGSSPGDAPVNNGFAAFSLFLVVILAARAMAFRLVPDSVLALDSGFYVAAALCLGPLPAGRLVALALSGDALVRWIVAARRKRNQPWTGELAYVLYFGGISGGLLTVAGWLWQAELAGSSERQVALAVVEVGCTLLLSHYTLQGLRQVLLGRSPRTYLTKLALPGMLAEISLLPLAAVLVVLWRAEHLLGFVALAATYTLITFVFNRLSRASAKLQQRVRELEVLENSARRLAASLQLQELVETVARETTRAIPDAEALALVHSGPDRTINRFVVDCYDRDHDAFQRFTIARNEGAAGWVVEHGQSLVIDDVTASDIAVTAAGSGIRSWLGVPIWIYGGCEGVLAIQSRRVAAFSDEHRRLLEAISLQVAAALQNAHLYEMAMVDGLTGLFVRRYFDARIDEEIERSKRYGTPFSVVLMDIDDFKKLNDTHGHLVGDRVLRGVSTIVKTQMRGVDTAARIGGEEIAIILPRTEMVSALNQAERIRSAIAEHRVAAESAGDGAVVAVTASFGIAAYPESGATNAEDLVRRADRALYRAKRSGKNRVELYWGDGGEVPAETPAGVRVVKLVKG